MQRLRYNQDHCASMAFVQGFAQVSFWLILAWVLLGNCCWSSALRKHPLFSFPLERKQIRVSVRLQGDEMVFAEKLHFDPRLADTGKWIGRWNTVFFFGCCSLFWSSVREMSKWTRVRCIKPVIYFNKGATIAQSGQQEHCEVTSDWGPLIWRKSSIWNVSQKIHCVQSQRSSCAWVSFVFSAFFFFAIKHNLFSSFSMVLWMYWSIPTPTF